MVIYYLILILAFILRLVGLENLALGDEGYSLYVAKSQYFSSIFMDAGNPPFYFLIIKLEYLLFHFNILGFKLTSIIFNMGAVIFLWYLLKNKFNLKTANIAAFIAAINIIMIYYSQEIRCYSLAMLLSPILIYFFFQMIQKRKNIWFIMYGLFGIVAINTHYYESIFLFLNFLFGIIYLKKRKKSLLKFVLTNLIILFSFLPFFIVVSYKNALLDASFNDWLDDINFALIKKQVLFIFGGIVSFILSLFFFFKTIFSKKVSNKVKLWLFYSMYIIIGTLVFSVLFSLIIRPIIKDRYYCFVIPVFVMFLAIIFSHYESKRLVVLFVIWLVSVQYCSEIVNKRLFYKVEQNIFNIVENNSHNYIIMRIMTKYYLDTLKGFENVNVTTFSTKDKVQLQKNVQNEISNILQKDKDAVIYTVLLNPDKSNPKAHYTCYYDKRTDLCLLKITN